MTLTWPNLDKFFEAVFSHYVENALISLFWTMIFLMVYATHVHNDPLCGWAQSTAGNVLSALFGFMVKQQALKTP